METENVVPGETQPPSAKRRRRRWIVWLVIVVLIAAGAGVAWYQISGKLRTSEPYKAALALVQKDPQVIERLGEPIHDTWLPPSGSVYGANADLMFKVAGPKGRASVRTEARKIGGQWAIRGLDVTFADDKRISLNTASAGGEEEAPKWTAPVASAPTRDASRGMPAAPSLPNAAVETPDLPPLNMDFPDAGPPAKTPPAKTAPETKSPRK